VRAALVAWAVGGLLRRWRRNLSVLLVFSLCVFLLAALLLVSAAVRGALRETVAALPDLTVQRLVAGRAQPVPVEWVYELGALPGVSWASERVWGYHYLAPADATFVLVGVEPWLPQDRPAFAAAVDGVGPAALEGGDAAVVGDAVRAALAGVYADTDVLTLRTPAGDARHLRVVGRLAPGAGLLADDVVLVAADTLRALFGLPDGLATDVVARVANPAEVDAVARKVRALHPDARVVTKDQLARSYGATLDLASGLLLAVGLVLLLAFALLVFDRVGGVGADERREVGLLRALGWSVSDVLTGKLVESGLLALGASLLGLAAAIGYVQGCGAPGLAEALSGWSRRPLPLDLRPCAAVGAALVTLLVAVPVYLGAALVPAWRLATRDADEVLR
jgi:ABC-type lipoprotein release transport system permease subunit